MNFSNTKGEYINVGFNPKENKYFIDRTKSGRIDFNENFSGIHSANINYNLENIKMEIYIDWSSIELFADDGRINMTEIFFSSSPLMKVELVCGGEGVKILSGGVTEIKGEW